VVICCEVVVGTNIGRTERRTAKLVGRTAKIDITTEGLGATEPFLSRFVCVTRDLEKFCVLRQNIEIGWQHFLKKVLEAFISKKHTRKFEFKDIDLKNTIFFKNF
jgi:hypothetical protein